MATTFGELLRQHRTAAGKKVNQLAAKLGYSVVYISDVERGRRAPFEVEKIIEAAKYLNVDADELLRAAAESKGTFTLNTKDYPEAGFELLNSLARGPKSQEIFQKLVETLKKAEKKEKA
jgi:transcriptional regulator with XRE-family HTH domain